MIFIFPDPAKPRVYPDGRLPRPGAAFRGEQLPLCEGADGNEQDVRRGPSVPAPVV